MNLNSFIIFIQTNPIFMILFGGVVVVGGLAIVLKLFGLKYINITKSIVLFAKNNLEQLGMSNEKIKLILDIMLQAITTAIVIDSNQTTDEKVENAMTFVSNICGELGLTFTDFEKTIIRDVFILVFIFINTLKISPTKVSYNKLAKANLKLNQK